MFNLLWRNHVDMGVYAPRRCYQVLPGHHLRARPHHQFRVNPVHHPWIPRFFNSGYPAAPYPNVGFYYSQQRVHYHRIGYHQVQSPAPVGRSRSLPHPVSSGLAPSEDHFIPRDQQVLLNLAN